MRVASNNISDSIVQQLQLLNTQQSKLQTQVGSGLRIAQPEDDPAAMARVLALNNESRALDQFVANTDRALGLSQSTYSALQQIKRVSDRAGEIGTLGTGAQNPDALQAYAAEVDQLIEQVLQLANGTLGNVHLFAGTATDTEPYAATRDAAGQVTAVSFVGNTAQGAIALSETSSIKPGPDAEVLQGIADFIAGLVALRDSLATNAPAGISAACSSLVATEDVFISGLARQGAIQTRIEVNQNQQKDRAQSLEQLISAETSTDLATTVVKLSQAQTAYQAALQSASIIMKQSLLDYIN